MTKEITTEGLTPKDFQTRIEEIEAAEKEDNQ